jgi:RNA polymerase sigma-70 factor (ECF subfamily)
MPRRRRADGFADFYRLEFPRVVRTITVMTHDRELAQEVAQEAFIKTYAKWSMVSGFKHADMWVRKVAVRLAIRAAAKDRHLEVFTTDHDRAVELSPTDFDLLATIAKLPRRQAATVALFYLEDRSTTEIAQILDCSEATVSVHLHRARKALAEHLREEVGIERR